MNTYSTDITIIGAGVIGLAISREIASKGGNVIVLERNTTFGQETSSRNSEVIHSGLYYPPQTLKAALCVEGKHLIYEICAKNNIPYKKIGKLIIAVREQEISLLDQLEEQGRKNGVLDLERWGASRIREKEPEVHAVAALYSPSTGIIDSHKLMEFFLGSAKDNGVLVSYNSNVEAIEKEGTAYALTVKNLEETTLLISQIVINCAGLDADDIANKAGFDVEKLGYRLHYCKGQYFRVSSIKERGVKKLIYPAPKPKAAGLGIHVTPDMGGSLRLGPDDEYLKSRKRDYSVSISKKRDFYSSVKKFMPFLDEDDLSCDTAGIRPKLQGPGADFRDFIIQEESGNGFPGFINLIGIESPGLTASAAIAKYVKKLINNLN
jgi:L-2-hydroxyglutarate oxidase LhgO